VVAGGEPDTHTRQACRCWVAVDQAGEHGGHANESGDAEALNKVQRIFDIEAIEKTSADTRH
jgi:hypothetical protein